MLQVPPPQRNGLQLLLARTPGAVLRLPGAGPARDSSEHDLKMSAEGIDISKQLSAGEISTSN